MEDIVFSVFHLGSIQLPKSFFHSWGSTLEQHNQGLLKWMEIILVHDLRLNKKRCQFGVTEITFLGDKLSAKGMEPDPATVQAILDMPPPNDKKGVLLGLDMVTFL